MKKINILLFLMIGLMTHVLAQVQVNEEERTMTQGMNNALTIIIPNADDSFVEKRWKKFMKSNGAKAKKIKRSEEWFSDNANIAKIGGSKSVDVYAVFEQSGSDVRMTTWFDIDGTYLSSLEHPERFSSGEDFLNEFELHIYKEGVKIEIKKEENNMKKLESEMKKLKKNNDKFHREIEDAKKRIAKAEQNIEENISEQEDAQIRIDAQKGVIEKTKLKMEVRKDN